MVTTMYRIPSHPRAKHGIQRLTATYDGDRVVLQDDGGNVMLNGSISFMDLCIAKGFISREKTYQSAFGQVEA